MKDAPGTWPTVVLSELNIALNRKLTASGAIGVSGAETYMRGMFDAKVTATVRFDQSTITDTAYSTDPSASVSGAVKAGDGGFFFHFPDMTVAIKDKKLDIGKPIHINFECEPVVNSNNYTVAFSTFAVLPTTL
jgi:hypothetical protein